MERIIPDHMPGRDDKRSLSEKCNDLRIKEGRERKKFAGTGIPWEDGVQAEPNKKATDPVSDLSLSYE